MTMIMQRTRTRIWRIERWFERVVLDRLFNVDERCEACRRAVVVDGIRRDPYVTDGEGVVLCSVCADEL